MSSPGETDRASARDDALTAIWQREHRHLFDIAFRTLGKAGEAEDVVQEAFARLARAELDDVRDPRGWLTVVVGRLCLDHLRSARVRREAPVDASDQAFQSLGVAPVVDPADRVTLDDTVRIALLTVLERLTPAERTAFVLHDVFQLPFETVAEIVGRSPAACRQLASRARVHVRERAQPTRITVDPGEHRLVVERFIAACEAGDFDSLVAVLDPDVVGDGTPGGLVPAIPAVAGDRNVARRTLGFLGPRSGATLVSLMVEDQPAVVVSLDGAIAIILLLEIRDGRVHHLHAVGDPMGLAQETRRTRE
jgi:RNA polymerase sigma-70 factor (ECF subfamily)